jgi:hypothetical protein
VCSYRVLPFPATDIPHSLVGCVGEVCFSTRGLEERDARAAIAGLAAIVAGVDAHVRELPTVPLAEGDPA